VIGTPGFAIIIEWTGPQDKPFPAGVLVSSNATATTDADPWVSVAVIKRAEFEAVVAVLKPRLVADTVLERDSYVATIRDG